MAKAIDNGGSAFPFVCEGGPDSGVNPEVQPGMSLRDYFAGQALAGILSNPELAISRPSLSPEEKAEASYIHADAMIARRVQK